MVPHTGGQQPVPMECVPVRGQRLPLLPFPNTKETVPFMATVSARLDTLRNWPIGLTQRPEELAEAGFYYTG